MSTTTDRKQSTPAVREWAFCPRCGYPVRREVQVCGRCGKRLEAAK
jgi:predicted amidophosphoribosyltransferase